jgi:hypothetical protein
MSKDEDLNKNLLIIYSQVPRVGKALELFWGEKEFAPYVSKLLSDGNGRKGFPFDVLTAILALQELHDKQFPQFIPPEQDDWASTQFGL